MGMPGPTLPANRMEVDIDRAAVRSGPSCEGSAPAPDKAGQENMEEDRTVQPAVRSGPTHAESTLVPVRSEGIGKEEKTQ